MAGAAGAGAGGLFTREREQMYVVRRVLGRRRGQSGEMEWLTEWDDGETPPPQPQHAGDSDSSGGDYDQYETARGSAVAEPGVIGQEQGQGQGRVFGNGLRSPRREEVDFR